MSNIPVKHGTILPMESASIKRIVAGQAITDLASAVKELIDNALDSGAKTINIRLFNRGLDILEVSDDGCGVAPESRPYIAMKHTTSKIRSFEDIYSKNCESLGFRGEALFCLANISQSLVVATRTIEQEVAEKLEFTKEGYMRQEKIEMARKVGTTVAVIKLFDALPVRRADLVKRVDSQRQKLFLMIQGYAIHCLGVKFSLIDIPNSGPEVLRLSTMHGTSKLEQTISSVLGSRFLSGMSRISIDLPIDNEETWYVEGMIAKAPMLTARDGSVARNAQFFCINGRPVDLPNISRTISEAWRTLEGMNTTGKKKKKPACVLHFRLPRNFYDINLSPDKRQVLLIDEHRIRELIYEGMLSFWNSQQQGKFFQNELESDTSKDVKAATFSDNSASNNLTATRKVKRRMAFVNDFSSVKLQHDEGTSHLQGNTVHNSKIVQVSDVTTDLSPSSNNIKDKSHDKEKKAVGSVSQLPNKSNDQHQEESPHSPNLPTSDKLNDKERLLWSKAQEKFKEQKINEQYQDITLLNSVTTKSLPVTSKTCDDQKVAETLISLQNTQKGDKTTEHTSNLKQHNEIDGKNELIQEKLSGSKPEESATSRTKRKVITMEDFGFKSIDKASAPVKKKQVSVSVSPTSSITSKSNPLPKSGDNSRITRKSDSNNLAEKPSRKRRLSTMQDLREEKKMEVEEIAPQRDTRHSVDVENEAQEEEEVAVKWEAFSGTEAIIREARLARIHLRSLHENFRKLKQNDEPSLPENVIEQEPQGENIVSLNKEDFEKMDIIGQFNLGFILAKCPDNNLWVLDQHACDEMYNFEQLCATATIQEQPLISPMSLELSPWEESCILDNLKVFEQNGFRFVHNPEEPLPGRRLALKSLPHSGARDGCKAVQFGKDDIHALCALLTGGVDGNDGDFDDVDDQYGGGTGVDGSGSRGNNAVRRHAGGLTSQLMPKKFKSGVPRLPKAVAMLANRACRNSIMIGKALSNREMKSVVQRMSSVEHPWNCPHGRPTMKHVKSMTETAQADVRECIARAVRPTNAMMPKMT